MFLASVFMPVRLDNVFASKKPKLAQKAGLGHMYMSYDATINHYKYVYYPTINHYKKWKKQRFTAEEFHGSTLMILVTATLEC